MSLEKDEASLLQWHQINAQTQLKTGQDIAKLSQSSSSLIFLETRKAKKFRWVRRGAKRSIICADMGAGTPNTHHG